MTQTTQINHSNYQNKINEYNSIYQKIKGYLKEGGFLSEENLIYPEQIVDNIYCAIESDKKHLTALSAILAGITIGAAEEDKKIILEDLLKKKIDNFICQTVFKKDSFLDFISDWVKSQKEEDKKTIASIHKEIKNRSTQLAAKSILKINEDIIFLCIPIFKYYLQIDNKKEIEEIENIRIDSISWSYINAALHFINEHDIDLNLFNYNAILQIGTFLEYTIKKGSLPENVRYFLIPAALSYVINNTNLSVEEMLNSLELRQEALTAFFNSVEEENETIKKTLPNRQFINAMEGYKTRTELAKEQLARIGMTENETLIAAYKTAPDSLPSTIDSRLPNLTELFKNQNENIAEKFRKVESIFIQDAIDNLSIEERDFFDIGTVSYVKLLFKEQECHYGMKQTYVEDHEPKAMPLSWKPYPHCDDIEVLENIEYIYSVINVNYNSWNRWFIIYPDDEMKYRFHEISDDPRSKYTYLSIFKKNNLIPDEWIKKIESGSFIIELTKPETLKQEKDLVDILVDKLTQIRQNYFYDHIYQAGYEATICEKIADFVKHLIPFYDAINSLREGKRIEAAGYFALDLLMFLPLIREAVKISTSMSKVLLSTAYLSKIRITRYLMTGCLRFAIDNTASFFFRQGILGASNLLTRQTFIDVLKAAVRSIDPGFELLYMGGQYIYKQSNKFRNNILQELNSYNDYSPIYQNLLISILSKPSVIVPLQKKFITHQMVTNAIELAQSNKYQTMINELTSLKWIVPKVTDLQIYPLNDIDVRYAKLREVNYPSANIMRIDPDTIASVSHLNIPNNPIRQLPVEVSLSDTLIYINISDTRIHLLPDLPKKLQYLNISHTIIYTLPQLPDTLTYLNISETSIDLLQSLPKKLKHLDISNTMIHNLPPLPDTLTDLNISITQIESLQKLPNALKHLDISKTRIKLLPNLPDTLTYLDIEDTHISLLPNLPDTLTYLDISNTAISELPTLPKKLTKLHASGTEIMSLPTLPITLTDLDIFDTKIIALTEGPNQKLPPKLTRLNISNTVIASLPTLPDTLTDLNIANTIIMSLPKLPKKLNYFNASNTESESLPKLPDKLTYLDISNTKTMSLPKLPDKLTYLDISNTKITSLPKLPKKLTDLDISHTLIYSLPKLPDTLTNLDLSSTKIIVLTEDPNQPLPNTLNYLNISNTLMKSLPTLPNTLTELNISNTTIDHLPYYLLRHRQLKRLNISNTPILSSTFNDRPPRFLFDCEIINSSDLEVMNPIQKELSGEPITGKTIHEWIEKDRVEFKITQFLPKEELPRSYVITKKTLMDTVVMVYDIPEHKIGIEDDIYFHFHRYSSARESIPHRFTRLRDEFDFLYNEVKKTKEYVIWVKNKILDDYTEIYNNELGYILIPKMVDFPDGIQNIPIPKHSNLRTFFQSVLHTKDILIIHQVINRFYFYVKNIEIYLNEHFEQIFFVSTSEFNLNYKHLIGGFTHRFDIERKVILMIDVIFDHTSVWSISHILIHEISHAMGGAADLFPMMRQTKDYSIYNHLREIATGKDINGLDSVYLDRMISEYTKAHGLPEDSISKELFLKIFNHDQMLRANIIMENADFIPYFIYEIARLE